MNNKIIGIIIIVIVLCAIGVGGFFIHNKEENKSSSNNNTNEKRDENKNNEKENNESNLNSPTDNKKILVVYFSATNNTKNVAEKIAKNLNADTFEIEPEEEYTSDDLNYNSSSSRVAKEHDDESLRNIKLKNTKVDNWENYDTIIIGYPIWWGVAAWPVDTFVSENDFNGKKVIPFCTSASSGLVQSGKLLEDIANGGNWLEGHRFNSRPTDSDIKEFTDNIN